MPIAGKAVGLIHTPGSWVSFSLRNANDVVTHYRVSVWLMEGSEKVLGMALDFKAQSEHELLFLDMSTITVQNPRSALLFSFKTGRRPWCLHSCAILLLSCSASR